MPAHFTPLPRHGCGYALRWDECHAAGARRRNPKRTKNHGNGWRVGRRTGAPGENRTPNLLVRSQALYPIELRAHPGRIVSLNYNGNRIVSPHLPAQKPAKNEPWLLGFASSVRAKPRTGCGNRGAAQCRLIQEFVKSRKSFRPRAKPTRLRVLLIHVGNALAMAPNMLSLR